MGVTPTSSEPLALHWVRQGGDGVPPMLVLHGFTGSGEAMAALVELLARERPVVVPDLIGHGRSPAPGAIEPYRAGCQVAQLVALIERVCGGPVDVVGYSMGARLALTLAVRCPSTVARLVLIGGTAGLQSEEERRVRAEEDAALADLIERDGIEAFVSSWERSPLFASQRSLPEPVRARIRTGRLAQREQGLANSLRGFGTGVMPSLWPELGKVRVPTLALAGELDPKFVAVASQLAAAMPEAEAGTIAGAGHGAHIEKPAETSRAIAAHLGR